jgi:S1-C subfamily serine protease
MKIVPSLMDVGSYQHPWLGIAGLRLTPDMAESFGLPRNYTGVIIESVVENGPADEAGLRGMVIQGDRFGRQLNVGDILIEVDNTPVKRIDDVISYLNANKKVGDKINLTVNRDGQILDLAAILTPRPALSSQEIISPPSPSEPNVNPNNPFPYFNLPPLPNFNLPPLPDFGLR